MQIRYYYATYGKYSFETSTPVVIIARTWFDSSGVSEIPNMDAFSELARISLISFHGELL